MNINRTLIAAARQRATVRLVDGRSGVIVYAPAEQINPHPLRKPPRHGDWSKCGVRFDGEHRDTVRAVSVCDIVVVVQ